MNVKQYLKDNILLFDGAMGTYFSSVFDEPLYKCEYANITSPNTIKQIHKRYLQAGAKAIKTNTFSVLSSSNEVAEFSYKQIIKSAYEIAVSCAKEFDAFVFCDVGTLGAAGESGSFEVYKKIVDEFIDLGGENFLFETFVDDENLNELARYIKSKVSDAFILVSFAVDPDGFTKTGKYSSFLLSNSCKEIDAVGFNCVCGPHHMNKHVKTNTHVKKPLSIMANASYPTVIAERVRYENNPKYFAKQMIQNVLDGAKIIGGCCGTTPNFTAQMRLELSNMKLLDSLNKPKVKKAEPIVQADKPIAKSEFYEKLLTGKKPIAVELDSPMNTDISQFMQGTSILKNAGAQLITIADCPIARARMDSSLLACKLKRELNINVLPHLTCRDRNINATKALLLGLNMEEINNVLIVTGDPIANEMRDEVKSVYEFNSRKLISHISSLNQTLFDSPFYLYAALNINARNFDVQLRMAKQKVKNGAMAFFTQPVLSENALENLKRAKAELGVPIVGGILPIVSEKNAHFINNEIPGITVSDEIVRLYKGKSREQSTEIAVKVSSEIAKRISEFVDGYYIMTPFKRVDIVAQIMDNISALEV